MCKCKNTIKLRDVVTPLCLFHLKSLCTHAWACADKTHTSCIINANGSKCLQKQRSFKTSIVLGNGKLFQHTFTVVT